MSLDLSGLLGNMGDGGKPEDFHKLAQFAKRNLSDFQIQLADAAAYLLTILISSGKVTPEQHMRIISNGANIAGCTENVLLKYHKDIVAMDEHFGTGTFPKLVVSPFHVRLLFTFDSTNMDIKEKLESWHVIKDNFYDLTSIAKAGPGDMHSGYELNRAKHLIERTFRSHNTR